MRRPLPQAQGHMVALEDGDAEEDLADDQMLDGEVEEEEDHNQEKADVNAVLIDNDEENAEVDPSEAVVQAEEELDALTHDPLPGGYKIQKKQETKQNATRWIARRRRARGARAGSR